MRSSAETLIDMRLVRQEQTFHVRGRVVNINGAVPSSTQVTVAYQFLSGAGSFSNGQTFDPTTGTFDVPNVPPGDYVVQTQILMQLSNPAGRQAELASRPLARFRSAL